MDGTLTGTAVPRRCTVAEPGPAAAYLELLLREAAPVEFERPLLQARADGRAGDELAELDRLKGLALQVRALLERRRRREAELSALVDTVGDLATLRDLDAVLAAIVRRARELLDTDVAYMTLNDEERGDTYMRVTYGSVSARFQQVRLPLGAGLGGLVAQSAAPYVTANYAEDDRFQHLNDINAAVAEEGLVAILGVPMLLGTRVLGVLFAANRSARPFTREEVTLLGSLAAHATVALDNTRLLGETRAALEELGAVNTVVRRHSESLERAAEAHDRMAELILRGGGLDDLAAVVAEVLGGGLAILDADGHCLAEVGEVGDVGPPAAAAAAGRGLGRATRHGEHWVLAAGAGSEALCTLVLRTPGELSETDTRILERAGVVTALLLLFRRSLAQAESRVRGELLEDLLTRRVDDPVTVRQRARRLGVDLDDAHVLVVLSGPARLRERAAQWGAAQAAARGGLAAQRDGNVILLVGGDHPGDAARRMARELGAYLGTPVTAGGAGPVAGPQPVPAAYAEAQRCAAALHALGRAGDGASAAELGFVGLLVGTERDVGGYVTGALGALLEYDRRRGTALVRTLEVYFAAGGSAARAADALHVHVNTVAQRLARIGQLLGADWQQPERALELQLALRLHRLRDTHP
ncbi:helix-turn-helix domain-containing protein [Krasilnikovia sp. M28-CT-15]|uniref:helix-turn-helix domain-containing protein n=1 Tax=Krasilnikovia sp. M28-CT-15 TaxID=3373540 RepID=UPI003876B63D